MPEPRTEQPLEATVRALAEQALEGGPLYVVDVEIRGQQGSRVVSVYVDSDDGATLDQVARAGRAVSELIDLEDPIKGRFRLDVSSPGADRPLTDARQYPRHVGRTLEVTPADAASEPVTGTLIHADDTGITLDTAGASLKLTHDEIATARVMLPW